VLARRVVSVFVRFRALHIGDLGTVFVRKRGVDSSKMYVIFFFRWIILVTVARNAECLAVSYETAFFLPTMVAVPVACPLTDKKLEINYRISFALMS
jgi:hypothetical protein